MLKQNWLAFLITASACLTWLRFVDYLAHRGVFSARVSRKIIHIGTGPLFVLCWLLFNPGAGGRYLAALIPLFISIQFALIGLGVIRDQASVDAMSRSGEPREILKGPLIYGLVFVLLTILFWKDSPVGIIALMILCGGDGMADLVGKRYGKIRLPWSKNKSFAGTAAVFISGFILSIIILGVYSLADAEFEPLTVHLLPIAVISLVSAFVESLPFPDIDNLTVPTAAVIAGTIFYLVPG